MCRDCNNDLLRYTHVTILDNNSLVFRYKLSKRLNACIMDRPCMSNCSHKYRQV